MPRAVTQLAMLRLGAAAAMGVGLVGLAGCDSSARVVPLDAVAQPLSIDVELTQQTIQIFANGTDQVCDCDDAFAHFAAPGNCVDVDDVIDCHCDPPSCLIAELTGTGVTPAQPPASQFPTIGLLIPDPFPSDLALHLGGCGHPDVAIPLEPFTAPTATVTAEIADTRVTARWQTDPPAASAYVSFGFHIVGHDCHTTANELTYTHWMTVTPGSGSVGVTAFLPVQTFALSNREIRIWRSSSASYAQF